MNKSENKTKSNTFVFLDLETTGIPFQDVGKTQITELSFISVPRETLSKVHLEKLPRNINKLTFTVNPGRMIPDKITRLTGLDNVMLEETGRFNEKNAALIRNFLGICKQPICLIAHNGHRFDFPLLKEELLKFENIIPEGTCCGDTLPAFQDLSSLPDVTNHHTFNPYLSELDFELVDASKELEEKSDNHDITDISDIDLKRMQAINETTPQSQKISFTGTHVPHLLGKRKLVFPDGNTNGRSNGESSRSVTNGCSNGGDTSWNMKDRISFSLPKVYQRMFGRLPENSHRAEDDVIAMIQCCLKFGQPILDWFDKNSMPYSMITPTYSRPHP